MKRLALLVATLSLSACMVGPDYVRPDAPSQAQWRHVPEQWKSAQPADTLPRGEWWKLFDDPELHALAERAIKANQTLVAADARYRQAQAVARQARAGLFPTVDAGLSAGRTRNPGATTTTRTNQLDVGATWEADLWGRVGRAVEQNEALAQASLADLESARLSVVAAVAQNLFALRVADAQAKLLGTTIAGYAQNLKLTQNRYAAGVAAKSDVVQSETQLKSAQAQLADLGLQRAQLSNAIAVLLGETPASLTVARAALPPVPTVPVALPSTLLERRPDIAAAERQVAAANARIGVARAAFFPALSLSGTAGWRAAQFGDLMTAPTRFWTLGAAFAQILFDGGLRSSVEDQARAAYDNQAALYRNTVLVAFQDVEDNLAALDVLEKEIAFQKDAVAAARLSVEMTTNRYKAGTASYLDVIAVETIALNNERTLVTLQGRRLTAAVLLVKALGGGWQVPGAK